MNFREEYIRAVEEITPDRQTIDRMKENVLRMTREKRAFPFKAVAAVGGTAAACAVITIAAVRIVPTMKAADSSMIAANTAGAPESASSFAYDAADGVNADTDSIFEGATLEMWDYDELLPENEPCDMPEDVLYEPSGSDVNITEEKSGITPSAPSVGAAFPATSTADAAASEAPEVYPTEDGEWRYPIEETPTGDNVCAGVYPTAEGSPTEEEAPPAETFDTFEALPAENAPENAEREPDTGGGQAKFEGYTLTLSEDFSECVLTDGERELTYKRAAAQSSPAANDISVPYAVLVNTADGKTYYVAAAGETVIVRNESYELVGLFE